ncbi:MULTISPECIES: glycan-binding surface protein [Rufibacter]|uniref:glycan-binding surface protein n=1 Tax=Rufibacter TaxID=1379908 RepID=UPI001B30D6AC|nr:MULTISPECIES: glycan-binding surface protein [Rufibacter]
MKSQLKYFLFLFVALVMTGTFTSCSEDDDLPNGGKPMISYVRVTRPAASDSLVVKAGQGQMIAIIGENLQDVRELWINDREAALQSTFITSTSIITRVPSDIPTEITNKMRLIFANGEVLEHDFTVDISEPLPTYMESEFVNAGEVATIRGSFFYEPVHVFFTGANGAQVEGEVVDVLPNEIQVRVPADAQPGPLTIKSNFGETETSFWFRDNRNIIADYEDTDFGGWWHGPTYITSGGSGIDPISGKFLRIDKENTGGWFEAWVGEGTVKEKTKNIPADAFANPGNYVLKFEMNTVSPLAYNGIRIMFSSNGGPGNRDLATYTWAANIDTKNKWQTVTIPFKDIHEANNKNGNTFTYNASGYAVSFHFVGPGTKAQFAMDNVRVVPNVIP